MARKYKCKHCGEFKEESIKLPVGRFCSYEHATEWATAKRESEFMRKMSKETKEKEKAERSAQRERKKATVKLSDWKRRLRKLVQQYVRTVRDVGANCCTCGNPEATEGGHYISVGSNPDLQFEETNIHPQCHECNCYNSGRRADYNEFILRKYGQEHYDWLNGPHPTLKERFPHWSDYEAEIKRYRKLLRDNGVTPCV